MPRLEQLVQQYPGFVHIPNRTNRVDYNTTIDVVFADEWDCHSNAKVETIEDEVPDEEHSNN
jgi:hypothetical protein